MKKYLICLLALAAGSLSAKTYEIKMLNASDHGDMIFEPGYLKVEPGDTVVFKVASAGHFVHSKAIPEGAKPFTSEEDDELSVTLDKEGVYVYTCPVHRTQNMNGVIQVGNPVNKDAVMPTVEDLEKRATKNQGRLLGYMQQVK